MHSYSEYVTNVYRLCFVHGLAYDNCVLLQWMTAGRGIVHSEMPGGDGDNVGLQLWINLKSKDKVIYTACKQGCHKNPLM